MESRVNVKGLPIAILKLLVCEPPKKCHFERGLTRVKPRAAKAYGYGSIGYVTITRVIGLDFIELESMCPVTPWAFKI